jgi:endoglucanase
MQRAAAQSHQLPPPRSFNVRVLVPCYKEDVQVVRRTLEAALAADLPLGARRSVYLCDDGGDDAKQALCRQLGKVQYVSGRARGESRCRGRAGRRHLCRGEPPVTPCAAPPAGETNGKSNNLNHCLQQVVYPSAHSRDGLDAPGQGASWHSIPASEVLVVFDADMACKPSFFTETLAVLVDPEVALCLTPQVRARGAARAGGPAAGCTVD